MQAPLVPTQESLPLPPAVTLRVLGVTDVGRGRDGNEDAFVVADLMASAPSPEGCHVLAVGPRGILLAVSDGVGGAAAGEVASALTLDVLRSGLATVSAESAEAALVACVEAANRAVFEAATARDRHGMGATVTAVLVFGVQAYVAEVGDSRAYLLRGSKLVQVTRDQSWVQLLFDNGVLTKAEAETHQQRNVILQAIGTKASVVVALSRFSLRGGDRLLVCSDGLTSKISDAELQSAISGAISFEGAARSLVDLANARGGEDNITLVLAEIGHRGVPVLDADEHVSLDTLRTFHGEIPST